MTALSLTLLLWCVITLTCVGLGSGLLRITGLDSSEKTGALDRFWLGFALLIAALQIWHFFLPVNWLATITLAAGGGAAGLASNAFSAARRPRVSLWCIIFLISFSLWLALRGMDVAGNFDSGLYHFSAIRWFNEYPIVRGLANLHERLGFNQSFFLFVAWANHFPWFNEGYHVANSLLCAVLGASLVNSAVKIARRRSKAMSDVFNTLLLPVLVWRSLGVDISSPTPDLAVFVVGLVAFSLFLRIREEGGLGVAPRPLILCLIALCATGCTLKLSFVCFGVALALLPLLDLARRDKSFRTDSSSLRLWIACAFACVLFLGVPLLIRGALLSGYPLFPSTVLVWRTDWTLPETETRLTADWIKSWAREPGKHPSEVLGNWRWLGPWWHRVIASPWPLVPLLAAAVGGTIGLSTCIKSGGYRRPLRLFIEPCLPVLAGLVFWFLSAPDPRFGDWLFWLIMAWSLTFYIATKQADRRDRYDFALLAMTLACVIGLMTFGWVLRTGLPSRYAAVPVPPTREFMTLSGLKVITPTSEEVRLWNVGLPSAPIPKANLELRGSSLGDGFRTKTLPEDQSPAFNH